MKNDPRVIYPGTSFYGGLTAPFGGSAGMGFNALPSLTTTIAPAQGMTSAPANGGTRAPPLSSVFGQAMSQPPPGSGIR